MKDDEEYAFIDVGNLSTWGNTSEVLALQFFKLFIKVIHLFHKMKSYKTIFSGMRCKKTISLCK